MQSACIIHGVVYLFEREGELLHLETRYIEASGLFEILWRRGDQDVTRETFTGETTLRERLDELRAQFEADHWHHAGPPELIAGAWKI